MMIDGRYFSLIPVCETRDISTFRNVRIGSAFFSSIVAYSIFAGMSDKFLEKKRATNYEIFRNGLHKSFEKRNCRLYFRNVAFIFLLKVWFSELFVVCSLYSNVWIKFQRHFRDISAGLASAILKFAVCLFAKHKFNENILRCLDSMVRLIFVS